MSHDSFSVHTLGNLDIEALLAHNSPTAQLAMLRDADCFHAAQLQALLDIAADWLVKEPDKARQLTEVCEAAATESGTDGMIPAAQYLRARAYAFDADFDTALRLIESARDAYVSLGDLHGALQTCVGQMFILQELGRYTEALAIGESVLQQIGLQPATDASIAQPVQPVVDDAQDHSLAARVYQNLGLCHEMMGQYDRALAAYSEAEHRFQILGMAESLGEVCVNRGNVLLYLGRGHDALVALEQAFNTLEKAGSTLRMAQTLSNIGSAHLLVGNYSAGLAAFERVRQMLGPMSVQAVKQVLLLDLADAYASLNLNEEALLAYREANMLLEASGMLHDQARALRGLASALTARSRFDEAETMLTKSAALFQSAGNTPMLADVMLKQAALQLARGNRTAADTTAHRVLELVSDKDWLMQQVQVRLMLSDLALPDLAQAQAHLQLSEPLVKQVNLPSLRYAFNQRLGRVYFILGDYARAQSLLETAISEVERMRAHLAEDRTRVSFAMDKLAAYDDLIRLYLSRNEPADVLRAFETTERAKARALINLMGEATSEKVGPTDAVTASKLQALQAELSNTYIQLMGYSPAAQPAFTLSELNARMNTLEREISQLQLQLNATTPAPKHDSVTPVTMLPTEELRQHLSPGSALVSYYICDDDIYVFVVTQAGEWAVRGEVDDDGKVRGITRASQVGNLLQRLSAQWLSFRSGAAFAQKHMVRLEQATQHILATLYDALFKPLEPFLHGVQRLIVVPHGLLHQVPFQALFDGGDHLIERFTISYAPSGGVWAICNQREAMQGERHLDKSLVVGVDDDLIPAVLDEARQVAQQLDASHTLLSEHATLQALRTQSVGCHVLHLACHGLFRPDNPMFSALKLHDGWLTAMNAMQMNLMGAWVTLSACESGRSHAAAGDEILGLIRAFLGAGATSLAVSLWIVHDATTNELMDHHYAGLCRGMGRAESLRAAQRALKAKIAHPYYWAPFIVVGHG